MRRAEVVKMGEDRPRLAGNDGRPERTRGGDGDAEEEVPEVRRLLLQEEHAVRAEPGRAVPHLPARRARPRAGAPAVLRLPHRTHARRLRLSPGADALVAPLQPATFSPG